LKKGLIPRNPEEINILLENEISVALPVTEKKREERKE
jgi:hypothetical protein